jgi:hypothetical protein
MPWALQVENHYAQRVRIYYIQTNLESPHAKLLGSVPPHSGAKFIHALNEFEAVWHIIVKDAKGRVLDDIKADTSSIREDSTQAWGERRVWTLSVGLKPRQPIAPKPKR